MEMRGGVLTVQEEVPARVSREGTGEREEQGYQSKVVTRLDARDVRLDYMDPEQQDPWVERWDGAQRRAIPRGLRMTLVGAGGQEMEWVFPVMVGVLGS